MTGPVTRVYWRYYSKYYSTHDTLGEAAYAIKFGDGNGGASTEAVYDEDGEPVLTRPEIPLRWAREVLND